MRNFVALFASLSVTASGALVAQPAEPVAIPLYPGDPRDEEAIVIPAGSPLRLLAAKPDEYVTKEFVGRFIMSGTYDVGGYGDNAIATFWPDARTQAALPHWRQRGGPREMSIANAWAFVQAVASSRQLRRIKAGRLSSVRGRATILADKYSTTIECDVAYFSASFLAVLDEPMRIAAMPEDALSC